MCLDITVGLTKKSLQTGSHLPKIENFFENFCMHIPRACTCLHVHFCVWLIELRSERKFRSTIMSRLSLSS